MTSKTVEVDTLHGGSGESLRTARRSPQRSYAGATRWFLLNRVALAALGVGLLLLACSPDGVWESLTGHEPGSLRWGPSLFRALLAVHGAVIVSLNGSWLTTVWGLSQRGLHEDTSLAHGAVNGQMKTWTSLCVVMLLGLALRVYQLDTCLWLDEVLTLVRFARPPLATVATTFPDQNQHMLYSILAHSSVSAFGEHAWSFRVPAVAAGVLCIPVLFGLATTVVTRREAWLATALLTVAYHHVWFSQNARGYTWLLLFAMLSTWMFLWGSRPDQTCRPAWVWPLYSLAVWGGMWTHLTMLFVVMGHVAVILGYVLLFMMGRFGVRRNVRMADAERSIWLHRVVWPLLALTAAATLTLQVYALSLPEFLSSGVDAKSLPSLWKNPLWIVVELSRQLQHGFGGTIGFTLGGLLFSYGLIRLMRRTPQLVTIFLVSMSVAAWVLFVTSHNLWPRFFFFGMGFMIILAVHGAFIACQDIARLIGLSDKSPIASHVATTSIVLLIILSCVSLPRAYALPKQDYSGAQDYVEAHRMPDDAVTSVGLAAKVYSSYFSPDWPTCDDVHSLDMLLHAHRRTWLVYSFPIELESVHPELYARVRREFTVVRVFPGTLGGGEVYVCRSTAATGP